MALLAIAKRNAYYYKGKPAFIEGQRKITFDLLYQNVLKAARSLAAYELQRGDRLAVLAENSIETVILLLAAALTETVMVPLNFRLTIKELLHIVQDSSSPILFYDVFHASQASDLAARSQVRIVPLEHWREQIETNKGQPQAANYSEATEGDNTTCVLMYTSGSTGYPKGCMLSADNMTASAVNLALAAGITPEDIYLSFAPLFHVAGLNVLLASYLVGATSIILPRFSSEDVAELIQRENASFTFFISPTLRRFVNDPVVHKYNFNSLRFVLGPGGKEPEDILRKAFEVLSPKFLGIYGQSEACGVVTLSNEQTEIERHGTCGQLLPLLKGRIVDSNGLAVPVGGTGELLLKGPTIFQGYWNNTQATAEALEDGWLHTGDIFTADGEGNLYLVDRSKYLIKTGGENVYPKEVENSLLQHPAIADAAIIGVPDPEWGEAVKAFLVIKKGMPYPSASELESWVRQHLAGYKRPRYIAFVDAIPRNHKNEVLREELLKQ